jgi:hypothetical protein
METIVGKRPQNLDAAELARRAAGYADVLVDLGAGDGRFVLHAARCDPALLAIGLDAARENLREASRRAPANALFVIANALDLPAGLSGLAGRLAVNFPWGSLLEALLAGDPRLMDGLLAVTRPGALLEARLNASALAEAGLALEEGGRLAHAALERAGFRARLPRRLDAAALRALPSTWARRMASGRAPEAVYIRAERARERVLA